MVSGLVLFKLVADAKLEICQQSCLLTVPVAHRLVTLVDRVAIRVDFASIVLDRASKDELSPQVPNSEIVFAHVSVKEELVVIPDGIIFECTLQDVIKSLLRDGLQIARKIAGVVDEIERTSHSLSCAGDLDPGRVHLTTGTCLWQCLLVCKAELLEVRTTPDECLEVSHCNEHVP